MLRTFLIGNVSRPNSLDAADKMQVLSAIDQKKTVPITCTFTGKLLDLGLTLYFSRAGLIDLDAHHVQVRLPSGETQVHKI